jgi:hypothetical protein
MQNSFSWLRLWISNPASWVQIPHSAPFISLLIHMSNPHEESYKTLAPEFWFNKVQWDIEQMPSDKKTHLSDGSQSFDDLYKHRYVLFTALCNTLNNIDLLLQDHRDRLVDSKMPWKSKLHFDGTMWEGWFIAGI